MRSFVIESLFQPASRLFSPQNVPTGILGGKFLINYKVDLLFFGLIPFVFVLCGMAQSQSLITSSFVPVGLLFILVDNLHNSSTFILAYFNKDEFNSKKKFYILTPIITFVILLGFFFYSSELLLFLYTLLIISHFGKQQYGFSVILNKKNGISLNSTAFDGLMIFGIIFLSLTYWASELYTSPTGFWIAEPIPKFFTANFMSYIFTGFFAYLAFYVFIFTRDVLRFGINKNLGRFLIIFSTSIVWIFGIMYLHANEFFWANLVFHHALPYIVFSSKKYSLKSEPSRKYALVLQLVILAYIFSYFFPFHHDANEFTSSIVFPFLILHSVLHVIYDSVLWKSALNKSNKKLYT